MEESSRFSLCPDPESPGLMLCTDERHGIVCRFERGRFNDTQDFFFTEEEKLVDAVGVLGIASCLREMGDWLSRFHPDVL